MRRPPTQLAEPAAKEPSGRFGKRPGDADHRYVNGARPIADRASCPLGVPTTRPGFVQKAPTAYPRRSNDSEHAHEKKSPTQNQPMKPDREECRGATGYCEKYLRIRLTSCRLVVIHKVWRRWAGRRNQPKNA